MLDDDVQNKVAQETRRQENYVKIYTRSLKSYNWLFAQTRTISSNVYRINRWQEHLVCSEVKHQRGAWGKRQTEI